MQRASPGRKIGAVSRMSPPTATKGGSMNRVRLSTSFHSPPVKLKTAHSWEGQQVGRGPTTTAIAWLAGPVNEPQSSCKTGSGKRKLFRPCSAISWRAVALVHGPDAVGVANEVEADALNNTTTNAATPSRRAIRIRLPLLGLTPAAVSHGAERIVNGRSDPG